MHRENDERWEICLKCHQLSPNIRTRALVPLAEHSSLFTFFSTQLRSHLCSPKLVHFSSENRDYGPRMVRFHVARNIPQTGFQDVIEVTRSLERQRMRTEEDPKKEASQQTSWSSDSTSPVFALVKDGAQSRHYLTGQ